MVVLAGAIFGAGLPGVLAQGVGAQKTGTKLPTSLTVLTGQGKIGTSIELHNIKAGGAAVAGKAYSAKADFHLTVAGHKIEVQKGVTVEKLTHDAKGKVLAAVIALNSDVHVPGVKSKHSGLTLVKSGKIVLGQKEGVTAVPEFQGAIHVLMPQRTIQGKQVVLSKANVVVPLPANGNINYSAEFSSSTYKDGFAMPGGIVIPKQPLSVSVRQEAAAAGLTVLVTTSGEVQVPVPNLHTVDGIMLTVSSPKIVWDNNKKPLTFDGDVVVGHVTLGKPSVITLAEPAGFAVLNIRGKVSYLNGVPTVFTLTGDVMLPLSVTDFSGVSRVVLKDTVMDLVGNPQCIPIPNPTVLYWQNFVLTIPANGCFLDFSNTLAGAGEQNDPGDGSWMGLYITAADLQLNTLGVTLFNGGQGFYLDGNGIAGSVNSIPQPIGGFLNWYVFSLTPTQSQGLIQFSNNQMSSASVLPASLTLPSWKGGNPDGSLPIQITINTDGTVGIGIDPNNPPTVTLPGLGLSVGLSGCSFQTQSDNSVMVAISGAGTVSFAILQNAAINFTNVAIRPDGLFREGDGNWQVLSNPISLPLPLINLELDQFAFGLSGGNPAIHLTGQVGIADGLPVSGQADFSGMTVYVGGDGSPQIEWGPFSIHIAVDDFLGFGSIEGDLNYQQNVTLADGPANQCLGGGVAFALGGVTGASGTTSLGGTGTGVVFLVVDSDHYIVFGAIDIQNLIGTPIILGDTDLGLYKFFGGFGHNMVIPVQTIQQGPALLSKLEPQNCARDRRGTC
jgi:hypothetical protein